MMSYVSETRFQENKIRIAQPDAWVIQVLRWNTVQLCKVVLGCAFDCSSDL